MNDNTYFLRKSPIPHPKQQPTNQSKVSMVQQYRHVSASSFWMRGTRFSVLAFGWLVSFAPIAIGSHQSHERHNVPEFHETEETSGHPIPGAPFQVFLGKVKSNRAPLSESQANEAIQTIIDTLGIMVKNRSQYNRFDEALSKDVLEKVIIEPKVLNRDGKEFSFLVARTKHKGKVKLLISAAALDEKGFLNNPKKLVPVLAREFQWVVSKASTAPKRESVKVERDLKNAKIQANKAIRNMSGKEREQVLQSLFQTYLTTIDDFKSLEEQPFYEVGSTLPAKPAQPDSTTKLYDIRVREALQLIVRDPYFQEHTPKAVRSLLNGKIWNVSFARIEQRDWATRTRVLPKDKSVLVGANGKTIQPAKILVNVHRTAAPDDPFYSETKGLPMGALSADQLARVIALEIQNNIIDKSMRGHVAQDEITEPK